MRGRTTSTPSSSAARRRDFRPSAPPEAAPLTVAIERVGHLGDGLGVTEDGRTVCVPYTLPGELVVAQPIGQRASVTLARTRAWLSSSPDRVSPPCPHFGACGGCALQHWADAPSLHWKSDLLRRALQDAGYSNPNIRPIVRAERHGRRRVDLAFRRAGRSVTLGLHRAGGRDIIDIQSCELLHRRLQALIAPLRALLANVPAAAGGGGVLVNQLDDGPDIVVRADGMPDTAARTLIADFARAHAVARVSWARGKEVPEAVCILDGVAMRFAGIEVAIPAEAFLQATPTGEAAIVAAVLDGLPTAEAGNVRLLELYAGCGTLTFALARHGPVTAYEGNLAALTALRTAANRSLPGRIACRHRDLERQPLGERELAGFGVVVLDPPFGGAPAQTAAIAKSKVTRAIYVSCNPAALRRDAGLLRSGGFSLAAATPIDQFLWSAQLESVAVFTR